ncbi:YbaB/EbfC family nucleoid-associated protein [Actinokineospora bangkokensis]|uniref:YbaB/EbfC DNA-binding family protein n=1 Tax=Actinokineospora bangkokensis TaxID=1193682 RepID=A0A1Q9LTF3_9PSEU|nr:YbaB/EbfC family nucleoid-associated protein [Actinokineospora bangkokensis]OLR95293.1 hypothetical protein BJP25_07365 [Actinokineospora bangkokensis]
MIGADGSAAGGHQALTEQVIALREGVDGIRATGCSGDGNATATVDGRGQLVELELDPRVFRAPDSAALAASVLEAVRAATERSRLEATRFAAGLLPERDRAGLDPVFDPALRLLDRRRDRKQR